MYPWLIINEDMTLIQELYSMLYGNWGLWYTKLVLQRCGHNTTVWTSHHWTYMLQENSSV